MREILADLDRWQREAEEIALATLVRVRGSAPRQPGARLAMTRSGRMAGSVSGGCVESDVFERALQVLDTGRAAVATYGIADEQAFTVGLTCGGEIDVLVEPFAPGEPWRRLREAIEARRPVALAAGLAPGPLVGRRLVIDGDGDAGCAGSIDADLDRPVAAAARELLPAGGTRVLELPWRGDPALVYVEALLPAARLWVVGATHAAVALCRLAKVLGFHVTVVDPRAVYASRERFAEADELLHATPGEALDPAVLDAWSYVAILSHDAKLDLPALAQALRSHAAYVGILGSRRTHERRRVRLRDEGFTEADLARLRAPIGLDLGGPSAEEIALSILAEIVAVRHGADGRALCEKGELVHAPG